MSIAVILVLLVLLAVGIWLTFSLVGLLVTLVVAGLVGWIADRVVPGKLPYGALGAVVAGLAGSFVGSFVLGDFGPVIGRIAIIPALLGSIAVAFAYEYIRKHLAERRDAERRAS